jgi:UDP-galactopyranose mutase
LEHKHFEFGIQPVTYITREYPHEFSKDNEPYYPINDERNQNLLARYQELAQSYSNIIFGGRLAEYKYYDMHQVIYNALNVTNDIL